jgi:hypothetical protein
VGRDYSTLRSSDKKSFPDLAYFTGLNCVRRSAALVSVPTYVPICATENGDSVSANVTVGKSLDEISAQIGSRVAMAFRSIRNLVYRLRACDYFLSVYAWNTRSSRGHDETFDYSWKTGCNSFLYEKVNASLLIDEILKGTNAITNAGAEAKATKTGTPAEIKKLGAELTELVNGEYDVSDDLNQRVQSCASIVNNLAYPANSRRFFCNYGGFIGAFLTASATAFGKRWGTNTSTQSQVQGLGTVMIALPALCAGASTSKKG